MSVSKKRAGWLASCAFGLVGCTSQTPSAPCRTSGSFNVTLSLEADASSADCAPTIALSVSYPLNEVASEAGGMSQEGATVNGYVCVATCLTEGALGVCELGESIVGTAPECLVSLACPNSPNVLTFDALSHGYTNVVVNNAVAHGVCQYQ